MDNFTSLLISLCNIQEKTLTTSGYTTTPTWSTILSNIPTRKDSVTSASISDGSIRENTDDDIFFFNSDVNIKRGNRILYDNELFDVIKVNKVFDSTGIHHIEAVARYVDHN